MSEQKNKGKKWVLSTLNGNITTKANMMAPKITLWRCFTVVQLINGISAKYVQDTATSLPLHFVVIAAGTLCMCIGMQVRTYLHEKWEKLRREHTSGNDFFLCGRKSECVSKGKNGKKEVQQSFLTLYTLNKEIEESGGDDDDDKDLEDKKKIIRDTGHKQIYCLFYSIKWLWTKHVRLHYNQRKNAKTKKKKKVHEKLKATVSIFLWSKCNKMRQRCRERLSNSSCECMKFIRTKNTTYYNHIHIFLFRARSLQFFNMSFSFTFEHIYQIRRRTYP